MFRDRKDAAQQLATALEKYRDQDVLVLGIPRGGVETAYYVARHLHAELSMVITRKLGFPSNPEAAMGAVAEDGSLYLSEYARSEVSNEEIQQVLSREKTEIERRIQTLRKGKPLPRIKGRTVILVDDGIATGATLLATLELCKKQQAGKIVVASPISSNRMEQYLKKTVDEVIILSTPVFYQAVSQGYESFYNLTDEEVLSFIERWEKEGKHNYAG